MGYWDQVVEEVVHGANRKNKISLTNIHDYKTAYKDPPGKSLKAPKKQNKKYYLGKNFPGVYFTEKELLTAMYLFYNISTHQAAQTLKLSKRTVEYYIKNIKRKLDCRNIRDLVKKIMTTDLMEYIRDAKEMIEKGQVPYYR